ncbi:MAG: DinB family protein [Bryobacteraceae bacterium]
MANLPNDSKAGAAIMARTACGSAPAEAGVTALEPGDYSPFFAGYVAKAQAFGDPVARLGNQWGEVHSLLAPLPEAVQLHRYAPGKWNVKEVLGHLIDTERIFAYRALRIARADVTPLAAFEENGYVAAAQTERCPWPELLEEFGHVRQASILMLRHLPLAAWLRIGTSSGAPLSVRAVAYVMVGHVEHHLEILRQRYL